MNNKIGYNGATTAGQATAVSVTTSETTMLTITDLKYLEKSQLTLYFDLDLSGGTITSVKFRVYHSYDSVNAASTVWYPVPSVNYSTGEMADTGFVIDSNSFAYTSNKYRCLVDLGMSSSMQMKVTAIGTGTGTATLNLITAVVRDN